MSLNEEERKIMVGLEYEKAINTFSNIELLINAQAWDFAANRLYYSLYHAISALLINDHHTADSHKGKVIVFGQYYVKTGIFTKEEGKLYSRLQTMRELADYNCSFQASREEVEPFVTPTKEMIEKIRTKLSVLE